MKLFTLSSPEHLRGTRQHFNDDKFSNVSFCGLVLDQTFFECDLEEEETLWVNCKKCIKIAKTKKHKIS